MDEQFGAAILRDAARQGYMTACPAEKSGQKEFDFEYGEEFARHIEAFNPTFCKVLVRYNPEGDKALNQRQAARLKRLSDYLHGSDRLFMFELYVAAEPAQMERFHGEKKAYDLDLRPGLMVQTLHELQGAGVEPDVWKVEGLDRREDCVNLVAAARRDGRDRVGCIILGAARTTRRCASGWRRRPAYRGSSASPWAARPSGTRWSTGGRIGSHARRLWRRSAGATGSGWTSLRRARLLPTESVRLTRQPLRRWENEEGRPTAVAPRTASVRGDGLTVRTMNLEGHRPKDLMIGRGPWS